MLGKILGKKKDNFFMELPAGEKEAALETPMAPKVRAEETPAPEAVAPDASAGEAPVVPVATVAQVVNDPESVILAAIQAASKEAIQARPVAPGGFAENYLLNPGNRSRRRRPGANMATFKSMAQNIKL